MLTLNFTAVSNIMLNYVENIQSTITQDINLHISKFLIQTRNLYITVTMQLN